jgi:acetolactate synthase regulatory subunit
MYEYKVLSQQDHLSGLFEPQKLEETLNMYAKKGWRVKSMTSGHIVDYKSVRDEVLIVLERKVQE